jgi:hypothetical protein
MPSRPLDHEESRSPRRRSNGSVSCVRSSFRKTRSNPADRPQRGALVVASRRIALQVRCQALAGGLGSGSPRSVFVANFQHFEIDRPLRHGNFHFVTDFRP